MRKRVAQSVEAVHAHTHTHTPYIYKTFMLLKK